MLGVTEGSSVSPVERKMGCREALVVRRSVEYAFQLSSGIFCVRHSTFVIGTPKATNCLSRKLVLLMICLCSFIQRGGIQGAGFRK